MSNNAKAILHGIEMRIREQLKLAESAGMSSLEASRQIGLALLDAQAVVPKGQYGKWAADAFGYSKSWWTRLKQFAQLWDDFREAKEWAASRGEAVVYSVDGAIKLVQRWRRAMAGDTEAHAKAKRESALERLRREFAERVAKLERQLLDEKAARRASEERLTRLRSGAVFIAAGDRTRIKKIWALWARGATEGERDAALARLREISDRLELSLTTILRECKLNWPDWTEPSAAA